MALVAPADPLEWRSDDLGWSAGPECGKICNFLAVCRLLVCCNPGKQSRREPKPPLFYDSSSISNIKLKLHNSNFKLLQKAAQCMIAGYDYRTGASLLSQARSKKIKHCDNVRVLLIKYLILLSNKTRLVEIGTIWWIYSLLFSLLMKI